MATNISGSISIHRLRNGQTVYLSLASDKALFQAVSSQSGSNSCAPDWTVAANQPTITPTITALGAPKTAGKAKWYYNGTLIYDSSAATPVAEAGWTLDADFSVDAASNYALTVKRNIALDGSGNARTGHDTFRYECDVTIDGVTQTIGKDIMATLQKAGDSGYFLQLVTLTIPAAGGTASSCGPQLVENGIAELQVVPTLYDGSGGIIAASNYSVSWHSGSLSSAAIGAAMVDASTHALWVARDAAANRFQVDGSAVLLCKAENTATGEELDVEGITVIDTADAYTIEITGDTTVPDGGSTALTARLRSSTTGAYSTNAAIQWQLTLHEPDALTAISGFGTKTATGASASVTIGASDMTHASGSSTTEYQDAILIVQAQI